ncbi:L-aspartate oxidase [Ruminococcus sp. 5_1_39BFAA]|uniref:L-aspartate oxidase n=1 Tax=Ruminococcus sp. 5_1_39BFAA TaxID=457412 RepID=UPI0035646DDD
MKKIKTDIMIVGTGVAGLFAALHLPEDKQILMITKGMLTESDSYLAQGGICVQHDEEDYEAFMEDTMKAGHYENRRESVDIMIRSSRAVIEELMAWGVDFARQDGELLYTREGAHSRARILYHEDITGEEITGKLLEQVQKLPNVTLMEQETMVEILEKENHCYGIIMRDPQENLTAVEAAYTIWACGGIGGLYEHSTNFPHLTGDALALALKHGVELEHPEYVQIHPTTLYSKVPGRRFLISESVRGEGAYLYNKNMERFASEVLPRDILSQKIHEQMKKDGMPHVWLDMRPLGEEKIRTHFPHIYQHCLEEGFDVTKECIPVVPAQHYFMGGVKVDKNSRTTMEHLYAAGETSCNGVHGANRLASNSLLESLVFAKRAALDICKKWENEVDWKKASDIAGVIIEKLDEKTCRLLENEKELRECYAQKVRDEIERAEQKR